MKSGLQVPPAPSSVSYAPSACSVSGGGSAATSAAVSPAIVSKNPAAGTRQQGGSRFALLTNQIRQMSMLSKDGGTFGKNTHLRLVFVGIIVVQRNHL